MDKPVVIYDGGCRFCRWSVNRVKKRDRQRVFEYLPRQSPGIEDRFPKLGESDFNTGMRLIVSPDEIYVGADAVYEIYRRLSPLLALLYRVPLLHGLFRWGYALVARYRHLSGRVSCDTGACDVSFGERHKGDSDRKTA